jgi:hypothetical protein
MFVFEHNVFKCAVLFAFDPNQYPSKLEWLIGTRLIRMGFTPMC